MQYELTILMPCLNEEKSIAFCINEAKEYILKSKISAEILIADNGSCDKSVEIAESLGARVCHIKEKGYGAALRGGIEKAMGKYIIMGDCDGSYDFLNLDGFVAKLREGNSLVMGNRFLGGIEKGAMPFHHKYFGVPFLSFFGRLMSGAKVGDFHCGLRGFETEAARRLGLSCPGMEFASEIICKFAKSGARMCEIPTPLRCDKREGKPHIRSFRDGFRHMKYLVKVRKK
ncbi:MAG: glycosyltransferase family 2 protein [Ruminococcaceae bacterium]|nr:glycosyltransferase family 2 protein [Oscillospiraceae bacterium]